MGLFKDTHTFRLSNKEYKAIIHTSLGKEVRASIEHNDKILAEDFIEDVLTDDRKILLEFELNNKEKIRVEAGWVSLTKSAITVFVNDKLIYESSPGETIMSPHEFYGLTTEDIQNYIPPEQQTESANDDDVSMSDNLDERDRFFDSVQKKNRGFARLFIEAIMIVAIWNLFSNRPGIDTVIMTSAVLISGLAAQILLRIPTISGGGLAITAFLLSYGLFQQFALSNDSTNKLGFTFTSLSIAIGDIVYYIYYNFISSKSNPNAHTQNVPNSYVKRSIFFFILLAIGNTLFALFAPANLYVIWSLAAFVILFYYVLSPSMKQRSAMQSNLSIDIIKAKFKLNKSKTKKKPDSDDKPKAG